MHKQNHTLLAKLLRDIRFHQKMIVGVYICLLLHLQGKWNALHNYQKHRKVHGLQVIYKDACGLWGLKFLLYTVLTGLELLASLGEKLIICAVRKPETYSGLSSAGNSTQYRLQKHSAQKGLKDTAQGNLHRNLVCKPMCSIVWSDLAWPSIILWVWQKITLQYVSRIPVSWIWD